MSQVDSGSSCSRARRARSTLPVEVLGSASRNSTTSGTMYSGSHRRQWSSTSSRVRPAGAVARDDRPETGAEHLVRHRQHRRLPDGRMPVQRGLAPPQLHPVAASLHHAVPAAEDTRSSPSCVQRHQVTGPVDELVVGRPGSGLRTSGRRGLFRRRPSSRASATGPARTARPPRRAWLPGGRRSVTANTSVLAQALPIGTGRWRRPRRAGTSNQVHTLVSVGPYQLR